MQCCVRRVWRVAGAAEKTEERNYSKLIFRNVYRSLVLSSFQSTLRNGKSQPRNSWRPALLLRETARPASMSMLRPNFSA